MEKIWNLIHLFKSDNEWENEYQKVLKEIEELTLPTFNTKEESIPFLETLMQIYEKVERIYLYPKRHLNINLKDENYQKMMDKAIKLYNNYLSISTPFEEQVNHLKDEIIPDYWKRYFALLKRKDSHFADEEVIHSYNVKLERIKREYACINDSISFDDVTINGENIALTRKNFPSLMEDENQENREKIYKTYIEGFIKKQEEIMSLYLQKLKEDIHLSCEEGYNSLLEKKLYELELKPDIFETLMHSIHEHLYILHEFNALKKEIAGVEEFHIYDQYKKMLKDIDKKPDFEEAISMVKDSLSILGSDYLAIIDMMLEDGWIDIYPRDGKIRLSTTSISYNGVPYICLNYVKSINQVRNISHEIGHAVHVYNSKENNKIEYFEFSLFLTEVVAKVNEFLFNEYLLKTSSLEERKYYLFNIVLSLINSIFDQIRLTEFEHKVINCLENQKNCSLDNPHQIYFDLYKKYYGEAVIMDEVISYGWLNIPHFLLQETYYLYQYSISAILATTIVYKIINEEGFVEKYKRFLRLGNTKSIEESLKELDIDLYNVSLYENAFTVLENKIKELKKA